MEKANSCTITKVSHHLSARLPSVRADLRGAVPTLLTLASGILSSAACAADLEPFLLLQHTSDLLRGPPFNTRDESQQDFLAAGVTIAAGERRAWELDLAHGLKWIDRGECEQGTQLAVRFYPGRFHRDR